MKLNTPSHTSDSPEATGGGAVARGQADRLRQMVLGLTRLLNQVDRQESACCGVSVGQCVTLTTLLEVGEVTSQQLGLTLGLAPSTVTRALAPLHQKGWLTRRRDEADGRQWWLSLTPEGTVLAKQLTERGNVAYGDILSRVPAEARDDTLAALELLLDACRDTYSSCCAPTVTEEPVARSAALETTHV